MKLKLKRLSLTLMMSMLWMVGFAQSTIQGNVKDVNGEPLIGVTVSVSGSKTGTVTDLDGTFSISAAPNSVLKFTYVGYQAQEIRLNGQTMVNVTMQEDQKQVEEVVVVGYGSVKKSNLTGALSTVKMADVSQVATESVSKLLVGQVPGLSIRQNSASPEGGYDMVIRGSASISAGNTPLYVIDGFPGGDINTINPADIESVEVLKDASATAIYGARAANGVILINTKKGKEGKMNINFKSDMSFQTISNPYKSVNAKDYMRMANEYFHEEWLYQNKIAPYGNTDPSTVTTLPKIAFTDDQIANANEVTNWFDEVTRTGLINEESLSINGGSGNVRYLFSLGHFGQRGVVINSGVQKYMGRLNLDIDLAKWLTTGIAISATQTDQDKTVQPSSNNDGGIIKASLMFPHYLSVYDEDGNFQENPNHPGPNPLEWGEVENKSSIFRTLITNYWNAEIMKGLDLRVSWGVNSAFTRASSYYPTTHFDGRAVNGKASISETRKNDYLLDATLTYAKTIFGNHDLKVMAGYAYQKYNTQYLYGYNDHFVSDVFGVNSLQSGGNLSQQVQSSKTISKYLSYFGRINYDIADKYLFTFTLRADGSDRFGKDNRYGYFPSGAFAWRVIEEPFMKNQNLVSNLKLRLSYGQTGNAEIGGNAYGFYSAGSTNYVIGGVLQTGVSQSQLPNSRLKWETTTEFNIGIDWGLFDNRLTGTFEYFNKTISDLLSSRSVGSYYPVSTVADNLGKTQSTGYEVQINSVNIRNKSFEWTSSLNFYHYKDKWKERNPFSTLSVYQHEQDPLHVTFGYVSDGLIQSGETVEWMPNAPAGSIKVKDLNGYLLDDNGDYILDEKGRRQLSGKPDGKIDDADKVIIVNSAPDFSFGFGNTLRYKNFDLNFFMYGELGRQLTNSTRQTFLSSDRFRYTDNVMSESYDRWTSSNPTGIYPTGLYNTYETNTDFYVEDADFLRLKNVTLGYTFPKTFCNGLFSRARLYVDAQNLFVITNYSGNDPETEGFTAYPNQRTYSIGVELTF
jgi:TonB-linked SusC/RagA family outer membrane protein